MQGNGNGRGHLLLDLHSPLHSLDSVFVIISIAGADGHGLIGGRRLPLVRSVRIRPIQLPALRQRVRIEAGVACGCTFGFHGLTKLLMLIKYLFMTANLSFLNIYNKYNIIN